LHEYYSWGQSEVWFGWFAMAGLTILFFLLRRRCPAAFWVWIAYLAMINLYTGVLQAGRALMADRYTYLAAIPLSIGMGGLFQWMWNRVERLRAHGFPTRAARAVLALGWLAMLVLLAQGTVRQVRVWRNSMTLWQQALWVDPTNPIAWTDLGDAYHHAGRDGEALRTAWEAVQRFPQHASFWFDLGYFHQALGRYPQALVIYRQAVTLEPDFADAYNNMGWVYAKTGDLAEAIRNYRIAQRLEPSASIAFNIASCQEQMGDPKAALEGYRHAAEGGFFRAWLAWSDLTAKNGDPHRALEILEEGLRHQDHAALKMRFVERLLSVRDPRADEVETARHLLAALRVRVGDQSSQVLDLQKQMEVRFPVRR
jgi:tetratricopeptide (TPR) repeat protein